MNYSQIMRKMIYLGIVLLFLTGPINAQNAPQIPVRDYWPTVDWKESTPEQQDMDSQILAQMKPYIEKELPQIRSVLIVRHGYLAYEQYFQYYNRDYKQSVMSVTKSISSALVGIALKEGYLKSLDQKLVDFLPEYVTPEVDPRVRQITLKHLLTMSSGFQLKDLYWKTIKEKIHQKPIHEPGEIFAYDSDAVNLLSPIMIKATGMSMLDFAKDKLFAPLGISEVTWETCLIKSFDMGSFEELYHHAAGGISLKPRDMAKFGYLYLNNGNWDGKQIIPSDFATDSIKKQIKTFGRFPYYGYLWWVEKIERYPVYYAAGWGGQFILILSDLDTVIVITSGGNGTETDEENVNIIGKFIIPSILKK